MNLGKLTVCLIVALTGSSLAAENQPACEHAQDVVAGCFTVHGRLSIYMGAPSFRIWRIGATRILGILNAGSDPQPETPRLPPGVLRQLQRDPARMAVFGDYRVCPLTKEQPEHMQYVCFEAAAHLVAKPRNSN